MSEIGFNMIVAAAALAGVAVGVAIGYTLGKRRKTVYVYVPRGLELAPAGFDQVDIYAMRGRSS